MSIRDAYESGGPFGYVAATDRTHEFGSTATVVPYQLLPGLVARAVHGERITLAVVDLEPGLQMSPHRHGNEQVGIVVRGEMLFTICGDPRNCVAGDTWVRPPAGSGRRAAAPGGTARAPAPGSPSCWWAWPRPAPSAAPGWSRPTAGCSPSATRSSSARWGRRTSTSRSPAWPPRRTTAATG